MIRMIIIIIYRFDFYWIMFVTLYARISRCGYWQLLKFVCVCCVSYATWCTTFHTQRDARHFIRNVMHDISYATWCTTFHTLRDARRFRCYVMHDVSYAGWCTRASHVMHAMWCDARIRCDASYSYAIWCTIEWCTRASHIVLWFHTQWNCV